jgi:F0F1-type ATP synthase assembly protein I
MTTDPFERAVSQERTRRRERRHQLAVRGFRIHLAVFVMVQILLFVIWWAVGGGFPWFLIVLAGWGIGLAVHAVVTYARRSDQVAS